MTNGRQTHDDPDPARWRRIRELFADLVDESPSHRARYLSLACEDDPVLRREVEALLKSNDALGDTTFEPAAGFVVDTTGAPVGRIGDYVLSARLGSGGAGSVHRAAHPVHGEVALKLLPAVTVADATARRRFGQEARALRSLRHPALCTLHEAFVTDDYAVLAMELIEGRDLAERLADGALGWRESLAVIRPLIEVLSLAHARGIVHRDVKPANVMLDASGRTRLIDFGIAKFADVKLTRTGQMIGSPRHMSPEQWQGAPLEARSDQFALGTLWYELLVGRPAFDADGIAEIAARVVSQEPPPLPVHAADGVPLAPFAPVLGRMLAKRADARFDDLAALDRALEALPA